MFSVLRCLVGGRGSSGSFVPFLGFVSGAPVLVVGRFGGRAPLGWGGLWLVVGPCGSRGRAASVVSVAPSCRWAWFSAWRGRGGPGWSVVLGWVPWALRACWAPGLPGAVSRPFVRG